jgi:hypothetical protein
MIAQRAEVSGVCGENIRKLRAPLGFVEAFPDVAAALGGSGAAVAVLRERCPVGFAISEVADSTVRFMNLNLRSSNLKLRLSNLDFRLLDLNLRSSNLKLR